MKIRPNKLQIKELIYDYAPEYLELFKDFHTYDGGWLVWPKHLLEMKQNLKIDNYVVLYEDERRIGAAIALFLFDLEELKKQHEEEKSLSDEQKQTKLDELLVDLKDFSKEFLHKNFEDLALTPEQLAITKDEFNKLEPQEQKKLIQKHQFLLSGLLATVHNYFSVMVQGEKLTSLVPKALEGDDEAFCKAVKIDRNLLTSHPYFKERYEKAQLSGERGFLEKLAPRLSTPNLLGKIRYPGLYFIFAMLDALHWLDDLTHEEILDFCDGAGLDRWQNRIEDVNAVTKQLKRYRTYQRTGGITRH